MPDALLNFITSAYGALLAGTLAWSLPSARRFFLCERRGGYAESSRFSALLHNRVMMPVVLVIWLTAAGALAIAEWRGLAPHTRLLAAAVCAGLCRYYFVDMRWRGILRGMGAPGFMCYWLGMAVLLLQLARQHAASALPMVLLAAQVDFALIMLSAGLYKLASGYARGDGMQFGLANPQWCYWWRRFGRMPADHWFFVACNQLAWTVEVIAGVLMLLPATRLIGGLMIGLSFVFIITQIRLAWLGEMVMVCCLLFMGELWTGRHDNVSAPSVAGETPLAMVLRSMCWAYVCLLPLVHMGLWWNLLARRRLPHRMQQALDAVANAFGIIIWRVFSADHTRFFVRIRRGRADESPQIVAGTCDSIISRWDDWKNPRFSHVGESIAITSIFTSLRYYPSNPAHFTTRLLRYARTLPCAADERLVFEVMLLRPSAAGFSFVRERRFVVMPTLGSVAEMAPPDAPPAYSAPARGVVIESARPGSYAPLCIPTRSRL